MQQGFELDPASTPLLAAYADRVLATRAFRDTVYADEECLGGWRAARGE